MNIKRGLMRFWIVTSLVGSIALVFWMWPALKHFHETSNFIEDNTKNRRVPVLCEFANGSRDKDYVFEGVFRPWILKDRCWYEMARFRELYPAMNANTDDELLAKSYEHTGAGQDRSIFNDNLVFLAILCVGGSLALLAIGFVITWVFAGFARTPKP